VNSMTKVMCELLRDYSGNMNRYVMEQRRIGYNCAIVVEVFHVILQAITLCDSQASCMG